MLHYLRIIGYNEDFGFVNDKLNNIIESDIPITNEEYQEFFDRQANGEQFRLKKTFDGTTLFDYVEPFVEESYAVPPEPTHEARIASLEERVMMLERRLGI